MRIATLFVIAMTAAPALAQAPTGPAGIWDAGAWLARQQSARAILKSTDPAWEDPLSACPGWDKPSTAPDRRAGTAFLAGMGLVHAYTARAGATETGRLQAVAGLVRALNLPDRQDGPQVRSAATEIEHLIATPNVDEYAWYLQFLRTVLEDDAQGGGTAYAAGLAVGRIHASMAVGDREGARDAANHLAALRAIAGEKGLGSARAVVDGVIAATGGDFDAKRLRSALVDGCGRL